MLLWKTLSCFSFVFVSLFCCATLGSAGDIVHHDDSLPQRPGCNNSFVLVKVPTRVNGTEYMEYVGVGARFGPTLESKEKHATLSKLAIADPPDCCSTTKMSFNSIIGFGDIILPGLLVTFALRYDWLANKRLKSGYFLGTMSAYGLGLLITYIALNLMDGHGQPALLYIVPFILVVTGTLMVLGQKRGELKMLWTRGEPEKPCPHVPLQPRTTTYLSDQYWIIL